MNATAITTANATTTATTSASATATATTTATMTATATATAPSTATTTQRPKRRNSWRNFNQNCAIIEDVLAITVRQEFLFRRKVGRDSTENMAILEQTLLVSTLRRNQNRAFSRIAPTLTSQNIAKSHAKLNNLLTMRRVMSQSTSVQMSLCGLILSRNSYMIYC
jgi:hypothetical protein